MSRSLSNYYMFKCKMWCIWSYLWFV